MQELQADDDLDGVEPGSLFAEPLALLNVEHQVPPVQVLHHEEEVRLVDGWVVWVDEWVGVWMGG